MTDRLFDRQCTVIVGKPQPANDFTLEHPNALKVKDLRIAFNVQKTDRPEPNTAEVQVFNLSDDSRSLIEQKGLRCLILAGYPSTQAQIFSGDVLYASHIKVDRDWSTKLQLHDGGRAFKYARVSQSFQPNTSFNDIVQSCVNELGLDKGNTVDKLKNFAGVAFGKGFTMHGQAARELTRLLESQGLGWSIQDGRIEILADADALNEEAPLISPDTGLIGSPAMGTPGEKGKPAMLKVKSLLVPSVRPGKRFQLTSSLKNGTFRAHKVVHSGDTFGGDWYTDIEATPA